ncbi:SGNH/GDSL hydrolase family protein [Acholeplasma sp. OttesenSCG-928-E16]|nr:SGNH/GDSL hydrolase family protein [Acholeplasma sp. OttesenSCG-928-E16]
MIFKKEDKIIFFGDSITWAGKLKEDGEGAPANHPFGNGFVTLLNSYFTIHYPELNLRLINKGIGGNRASDLLQRIDQDVIAHKPNWMFMMIGVNDAWRQFDSGQIKEFLIPDSEYKKNIELIVQKALGNGIGVILGSPFVVDKNKKDPLRAKLDTYNNILKEIATKYDLRYVDIQSRFDKVLNKIHSYVMTNDRIHLNFTGHMIIMEEILAAIKK